MPFLLASDELRVATRYYHLDHHECSATAESPAAAARTHLVALDVDCPDSRRHFLDAFARRPWWTLREGPDASGAAALHIAEYERVPWDAVLKPPHCVTNNVLVRKGLCRKAHFARYMTRHAAKCGPSCPLGSCVPLTAVIDTVPVFHTRPAWLDVRSAMAEALCDADDAMSSTASARGGGDCAWILKPSMANKGAELFIVHSIDRVEACVREWRDVGQWVLQRYVERPMLLRPLAPPPLEAALAGRPAGGAQQLDRLDGGGEGGGHKFHLRVYVLLDGALSVHVFGEALVLFAVLPYAPPALAGGDHSDGEPDHRAHITNSCVGVAAGEAAGWDEARMVRRFSELPGLMVAQNDGGGSDSGSGSGHNLASARAFTAGLWARIEDCVAHCFRAFDGDFSGLMPLPNAFELYGVDFLVDDVGGLHLLEFNPTPDIRQTGDRLDFVVGALIEGMVAIAVDGRYPPPPPMAPPPVAGGTDNNPLAWRCVLRRDSPRPTVNMSLAD